MKYRIILAVLVIIGVLIWSLYPCIILNFTNLPGRIEKYRPGEIIFLYGGRICGDCYPGQFLLSLKDRNSADVLIIVPEDFSEADTKNMKDVFMLRNTIIHGDEKIEGYLKKIAACKRADSWRNNFVVKISGERKIDIVRLL